MAESLCPGRCTGVRLGDARRWSPKISSLNALDPKSQGTPYRGPSSSSSRWSIWSCNDNERVLQPKNVINVMEAKIHESYLVAISKVASKRTFSYYIKNLHINIFVMLGFDLHYTIICSREKNVTSLENNI